MAIPAWQTDDLGEEWIESSPSPPTKSIDLKAIEQLPNPSVASINAKRGSLRALGHSVRHLPPPRVSSSPTTGSPRMISGHGYGRVLSEKPDNAGGSLQRDLLSPPHSADESGVVAGTFLVKEGVDDDRGKFLAKKGRDMFGPTALEKMFRPPSPVVEESAPINTTTQQSTPTPQASIPPPSTSPTQSPPTNHTGSRRLSHPYAPTNPSRLSKSVTPSTVSTSMSITLPPDGEASIDYDAVDRSTNGHVEPSQEGWNKSSSQVRELKSGEIETDLSPLGSDKNYRFTFTAPYHSVSSSKDARHEESSMSPFNPVDGSHSTLQRRDSNNNAPPKPLRLFHSTYDTYTREHLSALVDSIAIEASPSPSTSPNKGQNEQSPEKSEGDYMEEDEDGRSADSRSSKRMRMSPISPGRRVPGVRDWAKEGKDLVSRMRLAQDSASEAMSRTSKSITDGTVSYDDRSLSRSPSWSPPPISYALQRLEEQERQERLERKARRGHQSNPSTTSSTYLRKAEELMAKARPRYVSDPTDLEPLDSTSESHSQATTSRVPSGTSSDWDGQSLSGPARATSPRRLLRRLSASEEIRKARDESSGEEGDERVLSAPKQRLEERRPTSAASNSNQPEPRSGMNANVIDDLNRFVSATTAATSTTITTSFVKHPGPKAGAPNAGPRVIKPDDVAGIIPDRVNNMRYDKDLMRWVKDRRSLDRVDELGEPSGSGRGSRSRSEESEDVFAGMNSWGRESGQGREEVVESSSGGSSEDEEDGILRHADTTLIIDNEVSVSDAGMSDENEAFDNPALNLQPTQPASEHSPPPRPVPHHANSAPAIMTPRPNPNLSLQRPIRSALRNAQTNPSSTPGIKKQTQWHESVTPAPGSARRSVSFSDGKKNGKIRELHPDETVETVESEVTERLDGLRLDREEEYKGDEAFFKGQPDRSWMPSARTARIQGKLSGVQNINLEETPSKASRPNAESLVISPESVSRLGGSPNGHDRGHDSGDAHEADKTITPKQHHLRSFQSRSRPSRQSDPNATFLTECSFGVTHDKLVQVITDVYGSEPYWEHLKLLDLRDKGVESVARLKEFLPELEEVNLNENKISYLSGIPSSVVILHVAKNRLTGLTSVDHLVNLTFLDISYNNLDSVTQLGCLKNLTELCLDGNAIKDLSGVMAIEPLTKLSARKNKIAKVDLTSSKWTKLTSLDLSQNRITQLNGLASLTAIREINLENNRLERISTSRPVTSLRTLKISDNDLSQFDLSSFPKLRTLYADRNSLSGLNCAPGEKSRIENLSLRNQTITGLKLGYEELGSVKRLYLSGNPLNSFLPRQQLPNLTYLEIAACSLSHWPEEMYRHLPNLEVLNANYNYFQTLDGLIKMDSLRRVSVVGARLGGQGGRGVMKGLRGLIKLEEVDLRMNPSTLGFYLPLILPTHTPPSEADDPAPLRAFQNPLPSVTLATIKPPDTPAPKQYSSKSATQKIDGIDWAKLDGQFRKSLPDEWYSKRLVYRGLIMASLPRLQVLDGVKVEEGEKRKAGMLLRAADVSQ